MCRKHPLRYSIRYTIYPNYVFVLNHVLSIAGSEITHETNEQLKQALNSAEYDVLMTHVKRHTVSSDSVTLLARYFLQRPPFSISKFYALITYVV